MRWHIQVPPSARSLASPRWKLESWLEHMTANSNEDIVWYGRHGVVWYGMEDMVYGNEAHADDENTLNPL